LDLLKKHCSFVILIMGCVFLNNLGDKVLTFVSLLLVFLGWMTFTVASTFYTTVPLDELPLDEMTERYNHPIKRRVPKIVRREVADRRWLYAAAALVVAQVFSFYILWSYCISSKVLPPLWPPGELLEDPPSKIGWVYSYDEAKAAAAAANKPLFVDFYATWCIPCRGQDRTTLADDTVAALSGQFVSYKSSVTKTTEEGSELKNEIWNIKALPAYVFITAAELRARMDANQELRPQVVLEYTQSAERMAEVMQKVIDNDIEDLTDRDDTFGDGVDEGFGEFLRTMALCYAWGLLASLTPCVYPMLPTTVAMFAGENANHKAPVEVGGSPHKTEVDAAVMDEEAVAPVQVVSSSVATMGAVSTRDVSMKDGSPSGTEGNEEQVSKPTTGRRGPVIVKAVLYMLGIAATYTTLGVVVTAFV